MAADVLKLNSERKGPPTPFTPSFTQGTKAHEDEDERKFFIISDQSSAEHLLNLVLLKRQASIYPMRDKTHTGCSKSIKL